jgi:hypothetical protein
MIFDATHLAVADHYANVECAIAFLVDLYHDDVDIGDPIIFNQVLDRYNLNEDGFESEVNYIIQQVRRRIQ